MCFCFPLKKTKFSAREPIDTNSYTSCPTTITITDGDTTTDTATTVSDEEEVQSQDSSEVKSQPSLLEVK